MVKTKIGTVSIKIMEEEGIENIGYSTFGLLDEVHSRAMKLGVTKDTKIPHPLNRHIKVLNALDRDERFEKSLMWCTNGRGEVLVRTFKLKRGDDEKNEGK